MSLRFIVAASLCAVVGCGNSGSPPATRGLGTPILFDDALPLPGGVHDPVLWSGATELGGSGVGQPAVILDCDQNLELFVRGGDAQLWHAYQSQDAPPWAPWEALGGQPASDPVVARDTQGHLNVFVRGTNNHVLVLRQLPWGGAPWAAWQDLGAPSAVVSVAGKPAIGVDGDGRLEVFVIASDGNLWHVWQTAGPTVDWAWSAWENLGGAPLTGNPGVAGNSNGLIEAFARGSDGSVRHIWQIPASAPPYWSSWSSLGGSVAGDPVIAPDSDGRLELFARGTGGIQHTSESARGVPATWAAWDNLGGGSFGGDPAVAIDPDGRFELFATTTSGGVWQLGQSGDTPAWLAWQTLATSGLLSDPSVTAGSDGRLELFAASAEGGVVQRAQRYSTAHPLAWTSTAMLYDLAASDRFPGPLSNFSTDLGASTMGPDGKLYFFFGDGPANFPGDACPPGDAQCLNGFGDPIGVVTPTKNPVADLQAIDLVRNAAGAPVPYRLRGPRPNPADAGDRGYDPSYLWTFGINETPTGAFSYLDKTFVFARKNWPLAGDAYNSSPIPLASSRNIAGDGGVFTEELWIASNRFAQVAPLVVDNADLPGCELLMNPCSGKGVLLLGQGGEPGETAGVWLGWLPLPSTTAQPLDYHALVFYTGNAAAEWSSDVSAAKELFATKYGWSSVSLARVWGPGRWVYFMTYQKTWDGSLASPSNHDQRDEGIYARTGTTPWEWSNEVEIFAPDRDCDWCFMSPSAGYAYGAYILPPYTSWNAATSSLTFYYLMSTFVPYRPVLMTTTVTESEPGVAATCVPSATPTSCSAQYSCAGIMGAPPEVIVQCPSPVDFSRRSPDGTLAFLGKATSWSESCSDYDVFLVACAPGTTECVEFSEYKSPADWCPAPPPPPPTHPIGNCCKACMEAGGDCVPQAKGGCLCL